MRPELLAALPARIATNVVEAEAEATRVLRETLISYGVDNPGDYHVEFDVTLLAGERT